jgi:hypothetical protein
MPFIHLGVRLQSGNLTELSVEFDHRVRYPKLMKRY